MPEANPEEAWVTSVSRKTLWHNLSTGIGTEVERLRTRTKKSKVASFGKKTALQHVRRMF